MTHVIARAIACGILLLILPSCGIPPLRTPQPGATLPPDYKGATSAENSSQLTIEDFYNDPLLICLIYQALDGNRELKILNEEVQVASNEVWARSGRYLPFVGGRAGVGLNRYSRYSLEGAAIRDDAFQSGMFFPNPMGNFVGALDLTWQVDIWRQLRNARDAAGQRFVVASERRNYFVTQLVAEVAENYYRLMALDKRIENLDRIIELQERSLLIAQARKEFARGNQLAVLRFQADVRRYQSDKLLVNQDIIIAENRINFLANRYPQPVERNSEGFFDLTIHALSLGVPSEMLLFRPDIRQAERDIAANGIDVKVARANFYPQLIIAGGVGQQSFNLKYLFEPHAVIGNIAGGLLVPLINKRGFQADYMTANARQLQSVYNYQRVILDAFTEVINRVSKVSNYGNSITIKKQQLQSLESAVEVSSNLFQNARIEYLDVLLAQQAMFDARVALIDTKMEQLTAIVNTYQALGGGLLSNRNRVPFDGESPCVHSVASGENFRTISRLYYKSDRFHKALWEANKKVVPDPDRLTVGTKIIIPPPNQLDPALVEEVPAPSSGGPAVLPPPPPAGMPGPFGQEGTEGSAPDRLTVGDRLIIPGIDKLDPAVIEEVPAPAPPATEMPRSDGPVILPPASLAPSGMTDPFGQKGSGDPAVKTTGDTQPPEGSPQPATTRK
jgi:NodT family efflux transporter outer membrane factor (OMF) lipoprotein